MQKQRGSFTNSPIRRERPLYLILRRAILLPRAAELSLPVCRLPSQAYAQWLTFVTQLSLFRCILALTVPSAVGLVTHVPLRLYPDEKSSLQRTATRRHRTQLYEILGSFEQFFRKVTYFAKKRGTPCAARHSRFMPEKSRKLELVVDTEKRLVYTVIWLKLESFRKVCYFAKIFVPFFG